MHIIFGMQWREASKVCIKSQRNDCVVLLFDAMNVIENPLVLGSIWTQAAWRI